MVKFDMLRRDSLKTLAWAGLWLGTAGGLLACSGEKKAGFHSTDLTGVDYAKSFTLSDHEGQTRTLADFKGKVVAIFFGYTQCPDVCPTTMLEMADIKKRLGEDGERLQVLFISVDPERDTPEVLKGYMQSFDPSFLGLYTESPEALAALARDFKIFYQKAKGRSEGSYTVDHSAITYLYDPQGKLRLFARYDPERPDADLEKIADDIRKLLKGA